MAQKIRSKASHLLIGRTPPPRHIKHALKLSNQTATPTRTTRVGVKVWPPSPSKGRPNRSNSDFLGLNRPNSQTMPPLEPKNPLEIYFWYRNPQKSSEFPRWRGHKNVFHLEILWKNPEFITLAGCELLILLISLGKKQTKNFRTFSHTIPVNVCVIA